MAEQGEVSSSGEEMGRRKFMMGMIGVVAGTVGLVVGLPAIGYVISPGVKRNTEEEWYPLGPISSLTPGVPTGFPYSYQVQDGWQSATVSGMAYAVTQDGTTVTVFSDVCTHLSCRVTWHDDSSLFICPCHDAEFSAEGQVVAGPPPRPLDEFESRVENGQIEILLGA
jgi:Rieske Fe-S protein